jgi:hypothetical protein
MRSLQSGVYVTLLTLALALGCSKPAEQPATTTAPGGTPTSSAAPGSSATAPAGSAAQPANKPGLIQRLTGGPVTVPEGSVITVRLGNAVGSKISRSGEEFTATVAEPVEVEKTVVIPAGATATGVVVNAVPRGRFKGAASLRVALKSVTVKGATYPVETSTVARSMKGKGKRSATLIGGGAGLGAIIGGIAGGGKGAAIGALAGGGAGTAGTAFTDNKDIVLPAESALSFRLAQPVQIKP